MHDCCTTHPATLPRCLRQACFLPPPACHGRRVFNFDFILPSIPGKLWAPPPADKGVLSEEELVARYLLPATVSSIGWSALCCALLCRAVFSCAALRCGARQGCAAGGGCWCLATCIRGECVCAVVCAALCCAMVCCTSVIPPPFLAAQPCKPANRH